MKTGTRERVAIPRPEGTIGTYHTHPFGSPFPSPIDIFEATKYNDKIMCIGSTGVPGTKIQCFTPREPKWSEIQFKFRLLVDDIKDYNKKISAKFRGTARELGLKVARTEPTWYNEGKILIGRRTILEEDVKQCLRNLAAPEEWKAMKHVNGFEEAPYSEVHPSMFSKCRVCWETFKGEEEELPVEL
ncbi:hypothetical protein ES703_74668 [subsurface metagenome]